MAESTLSIAFDDLKSIIGHYLGYGRESTKWTDDEITEIEEYVQAGVRQFYYPPAAEGVEEGYGWSFLTPRTTLDTTADQGEDDLPDDCGRILGSMYHDEDVYASDILVVSRHQLLHLRSNDESTGTPRFVAVREKTSDGATGQRKELMWWPSPDAVYTIAYQYEAYQGILDGLHQYPLGGMKHSDLVTESCLAVAEQRSNDEKGLHWDLFINQLKAAIARDRKNSAQYYGSLSGPDQSVLQTARSLRHGEVTYNGDTW
ncbi:MAG: hypothetical protein ACXABD_20710 [Candidatus Thorarchaeota archaeon]|jgi:hypothetical protein